MMVIALAILTVQVVDARSAYAAACGTVGNYHAGYAHFGANPVQLEGASADIIDSGGYVLCTPGGQASAKFSTSWSMVVSANLGGYAQSGTMYRWGYGSCVKFWAQQRQSSSHMWTDHYIGGCSLVGEVHRWWQEFVNVGGVYRIRSKMDSIVIRESSFSPTTSWTTPYGVQFMSETTYLASNVPGDSFDRQDFIFLRVQKWLGDGWVTACGNTNLVASGYSTRYDRALPACNHVEAWTKPS